MNTSSGTGSTPPSGAAWRRLGFFHEIDPEARTWRFCGARDGLLRFVSRLRRYADTCAESPRPRPFPLGPYGDLQLKYWQRPGIDDESVHGSSDDLRRLADLVETRLAGAAPGTEVTVGPEYASDLEYSLIFDVRDDDFDPAVAPARAEVEVQPEPRVTTPSVPFKFHDPDAFTTETEGLVRLDGDVLVIQYEKKDAFFGVWKSGVREVRLPLDAVVETRFKTGPFSTHLIVRANDLTVLGELPSSRAGTLRLNFRRADREAAAELAGALEEAMSF